MKMKLLVKSMIFVVTAAFVQLAAHAHTGLKESMPADGTTISTAPNEITLTFSGDVKLIKLELMGVGHEMPTSFEPSTAAKATYTFETPGMHPGKFTVNWAAIGADGHTLTDSFEFEVDPASTASISQ
ncbi:MAG: copper resistance protein CopC [Pseudohongiellaceae bacterium]